MASARRTLRVLLACVCALAVAGLVGAVVRQSWQGNRDAGAVVRLEQQGAEILHPLTTLLAEVVQAQSAAVRAEAVNAESLRRAVRAVAEIDAEYGEALGTRQRLADLSDHVEAALAQPVTGRAAYETYSGIVTLTVDVIRAVGDASHLVHDPDLDSFYLMDAAVVRLPDAMVFAGRAADLVALANGRPLAGEDAVRAAVARFGVSDAAERVNAGLTKSVDVTESAALGANIAQRLDAFKAAADQFAPPTMLAELSDPVPAATLAANAARVYAAANPLAHRLLSELQALLDVRAAKLADQRAFTTVATATAGVFGLFAIGLLAWTRPRRRVVPADGGPDGRWQGAAVGPLTEAQIVLDRAARGARAAPSRGGGDAG